MCCLATLTVIILKLLLEIERDCSPFSCFLLSELSSENVHLSLRVDNDIRKGDAAQLASLARAVMAIPMERNASDIFQRVCDWRVVVNPLHFPRELSDDSSEAVWNYLMGLRSQQVTQL